VTNRPVDPLSDRLTLVGSLLLLLLIVERPLSAVYWTTHALLRSDRQTTQRLWHVWELLCRWLRRAVQCVGAWRGERRRASTAT